jgi:chromosome segregation ATPase
MLLDMWVVFTVGLALAAAIGVAALMALRASALAGVRAELDKRCKAAQTALEEGKKLLEARPTAVRDWKQELATRLETLDAQAAAATEVDPVLAIRREVLRSEIDGAAPDLGAHLNRPVQDDGGATPAAAEFLALKASHAALETELAALKSERESPAAASEGAPTNLARERELKSLVQQFTRDSREMLACIQSLESENRELRASVGGTAKSAA